MGSYIPSFLQGGIGGGAQLALAAVYESRVHTVSRMLVPRPQFAGDTAVTLTDGSISTRDGTTPSSVPQSATAFIANNTNSKLGADVYGKPMIIKLRRDEFDSEVGVLDYRKPGDTTSPKVLKDYAVFNADGTYPGGIDPWDYTAGTGARYRVNTATGEIYINNNDNLIELNNPDGLVNFNMAGYNELSSPPVASDNGMTQQKLPAGTTGMEGYQYVVGVVSFDTLQGGALSATQQQASELSGVIQSLTSIIRSINDGKRGVLNIVK